LTAGVVRLHETSHPFDPKTSFGLPDFGAGEPSDAMEKILDRRVGAVGFVHPPAGLEAGRFAGGGVRFGILPRCEGLSLEKATEVGVTKGRRVEAKASDPGADGLR